MRTISQSFLSPFTVGMSCRSVWRDDGFCPAISSLSLVVFPKPQFAMTSAEIACSRQKLPTALPQRGKSLARAHHYGACIPLVRYFLEKIPLILLTFISGGIGSAYEEGTSHRRIRRRCGKQPHGEDNMDNQLDYEINKELGECYLFMGDFDKAEEYYRKAASNNAQSAAPYMGLATVAVQRSELEKALVLYQKAAAVEETDKALCGIGLVYMEQGKHEDAFSHFARALDKSAANIVALNCLVREAYQLGCVEQVLPYLEAALACSEEAEAVRVTLAGCLIYLGRSDEARQHLETVLGANPSNNNAKELFDTMAA